MTTIAPVPVAAEGVQTFSASLTLIGGYAFRVDFDDALAPLQTDEPPPLGKGNGPAPSRMLAAAVMNCLASSLLFCLRKSRVEVGGMAAKVVATLGRTDAGRLRVDRLEVSLEPSVPAEHIDRVARCTDLFEDYCVVTESVRHGIDVRVTVAATENFRKR